MKLAVTAGPAGTLRFCHYQTFITPVRRRRIACRLSPYSAYYDVQQYGLASAPLVPAEAQHHLDHLVRGAANAFGPLYFATFCALSITLGALLYNLTGVLNEYFAIQEQLTSKSEERPLLYGVDVSRSAMFRQLRVRAAADFAAAAHAGQTRKTGEPYVSHCIETALIVEANLPRWRQDSRHETAVIAALLHDVLDDTATTPEQITAAFGPAVSAMVVKVSKLSQVNQMLRRDKRKGVVSVEPSYWQSQWLRLKRMMFEAVVEEPLVILVKLADRLHNMRTVYALHPAKQQAVAEETLAVWCSMAASLGWHGIKSEMEDLCFAVVDQATFCTLRQQLDKLWSSPPAPRSRRKVRSSRRQQQLQALAQQQQEMAEARAWAWEEGMGQSLRDLRSLLGLSRTALVVNPAAAAAKRLPAAAGGGEQLQQPAQAGVAGPQHSSSAGTTDVHTQPGTPPSPPLAHQQGNLGLHLLSRFWLRSGAAPLLPAPPEDYQQDQQRGLGGNVGGGTDASLSLMSLLGSRWAVGLQQQQQQQGPDQLALAAAGGAATSTAAAEPQQVQPVLKQAALLTAQQQQLRNVLSTVVAFDAVNLKGNRGLTWSAQQGLSVLEEAAGRLYNELSVGSFGSGLQVEVQGRLKSLRSIHNKVQRKNCSVEEVYDARALRVVVDDAGGKRLADAVQCCYRLVSAVHKLWHPIHGEFDDYIANPKPSGYQALHTAVWGPGGAALEVQIKTSGMHEHAEYGGAAHWAYKEVLWGSAPAAAAAVGAVEAAVVTAGVVASSNGSSSSGGGSSRPGLEEGVAVVAAAAAAKKSVQVLPPVLFTFDTDGKLLSSSSELAAAVGSGSSSNRRSKLLSLEMETAATGDSRELAGSLAAAASTARTAAASVRIGGAVSGRGASPGTATAVAVVERPGTVAAVATAVGQKNDMPLLSRIAALSQQQQAQEPPSSSSAVQTLQRPALSGGSSGSGSSSRKPLSNQQQQQQQSPKPGPKVYVGQPVLRISGRLRYGVVLAVFNDNSSSGGGGSWSGLPAAGVTGLVNPLAVPVGAGGDSAWSDPAASPGGGRVSLFCVIMSGGTNPDHPWRMPDYGFYHELLQYATAAGWVRPGQGDWHARLEEYEWCRDGRWHRRDHLGYLHPHTTLTLLEGYEQDAAQAAAAAAAASASSAAASANTLPARAIGAANAADAGLATRQCPASLAASAPGASAPGGGKGRSPKMLLHSWATGGSQNSQSVAKVVSNISSSSGRDTAAGSGSASGKATSSSGNSVGNTQQQPPQQQAGSVGAPTGTAAAADPAAVITGVQAAGPDWAATAAKAAQLRSVIEWGLEAYGVEDSQQGGEVSVVIWPGGVIEDVPRGTTAGEILREKGVLAILDATTDSDAESSDSGRGSRASSSSSGGAGGSGWQQPGRDGGSGSDPAGPGAPAAAADSGVAAQRMVNVNNRLVSEDTVLSDGDLVILARERIKI